MALPIPSLPTDNLYKFIALSGAVLTIFCLTLIFIEGERLERSGRLVEIQSQELDGLTEIISYKLNLAKNAENEKNSKVLLESVQTDLKRYSTDFKNHVETIVDAPKKVSERKTNLAWLGLWMGLILSIFGFSLWYLKVQRLLDQILKYELKNKILESLTK